jgi:RNA recognition motif-containing protein
MRGVPFKATDEEILEFFAGYDIIRSSLKFKLDEAGRRSGQVCVLFTSKAESLRALNDRHEKYLGQRSVELIEADK